MSKRRWTIVQHENGKVVGRMELGPAESLIAAFNKLTPEPG